MKPKLIIPALLALTLTITATGTDKAATGLLLVCNKGDHTLSIIAPDSAEQLAAVDVDGVTGHEVIASADGKLAFVPIFGNSGVGRPGTDGQFIRVVDLEKRAVVHTIDFGKGVRPHCAMIGPKDHLLYVTTELENSVTVIDPDSFKILHSVPTGQAESHMLAIARAGRLGYTANVGSGTVSVLDLEQRRTLKIIPVSKTTQRIAISPDDKWVFTADQIKPQLAVIDTGKNEVAKWIELPGIGYGAAPTPDGKWLVIALPAAQKVAVLDLKTMKVRHTLAVPKAPQETLVHPDGRVAYVSCDASKQVAVIDLEQMKVTKLISAGTGADGLAWAKR